MFTSLSTKQKKGTYPGMHNLTLMNVSIGKLQLEELLYHNTLQVSLRILKNTCLLRFFSHTLHVCLRFNSCLYMYIM